jgi:hypothetical protein
VSTAISVVQRNENPIEIIQWDGGQETADWLAERFGDQVAFSGDDGNLQMTLWTTWQIERGWWIADSWGSPNPMAPDQLSQYTYPRRSIEVPELPPIPEPAPEEEPSADEPSADEPPADAPPAEDPGVPDAPVEETDSGGNQ